MDSILTNALSAAGQQIVSITLFASAFAVFSLMAARMAAGLMAGKNKAGR